MFLAWWLLLVCLVQHRQGAFVPAQENANALLELNQQSGSGLSGGAVVGLLTDYVSIAKNSTANVFSGPTLQEFDVQFQFNVQDGALDAAQTSILSVAELHSGATTADTALQNAAKTQTPAFYLKPNSRTLRACWTVGAQETCCDSTSDLVVGERLVTFRARNGGAFLLVDGVLACQAPLIPSGTNAQIATLRSPVLYFGNNVLNAARGQVRNFVYGPPRSAQLFFPVPTPTPAPAPTPTPSVAAVGTWVTPTTSNGNDLLSLTEKSSMKEYDLSFELDVQQNASNTAAAAILGITDSAGIRSPLFQFRRNTRILETLVTLTTPAAGANCSGTTPLSIGQHTVALQVRSNLIRVDVDGTLYCSVAVANTSVIKSCNSGKLSVAPSTATNLAAVRVRNIVYGAPGVNAIAMYLSCSVVPADQRSSFSVSLFGAVPNNEVDDAEAIRFAIDCAQRFAASGPVKVKFEAGVYDLLTSRSIRTTAYPESRFNSFANTFIDVRNVVGLTIEGAPLDSQGNPTTIWRVANKFVTNIPNSFDFNYSCLSFDGNGNPTKFNAPPQPRALTVYNAAQFTLRKIAIDMDIAHSLAGVITEANKATGSVEIELLDDTVKMPRVLNMPFFSANLFVKDSSGNWFLDPSTGTVTSGTQFPANVSNPGAFIPTVLVASQTQRRLKAVDKRLANVLNSGTGSAIGKALSVQMSASTEQLVLFFKGQDHVIEDFQIYTTFGFAVMSAAVRNIRTANVKIAPRPDRKYLQVGARDAWKLWSCDGTVTQSNLWMEGVRMDGQNAHLLLYRFDSIAPDRKSAVLFMSLRTDPDLTIVADTLKVASCAVDAALDDTFIQSSPGNALEVYDIATKAVKTVPVLKAGYCGALATKSGLEGGTLTSVASAFGYVMQFAEPLPDFVMPFTSPAAYLKHDIDYYALDGCRMRNIAGSGHVIKTRNVSITNCVYESVMLGMTIGPEISGLLDEGTSPLFVSVQNSVFLNSGWGLRSSNLAWGSLNVGAHGRSVISEVSFVNNHFGAVPRTVVVFDGPKDGSTAGRYADGSAVLLRDVLKATVTGSTFEAGDSTGVCKITATDNLASIVTENTKDICRLMGPAVDVPDDGSGGSSPSN